MTVLMTVEAPATPDPLRRRVPAMIGPAAGVLMALLAVLGTWLALDPGGRSLHGLMDDNVLNNAINGVVFGTIAAILLALRPSNRVGWLLFYVAAVSTATILGEGWTLASFHDGLPGRALAAWVGSWVWVTALPLGATVLPAIYPTGRAVGRFARWVVRLGWAGSLVAGFAVAMLDGAYQSVAPGHPLGHNPVSGGRGHAVFTAIAVSAVAVEVVLVMVTFAWTLRRLRRAASPEREQLAWLVVSVMPLLVGFAIAPPPVMLALTVATSVTLVLGIVRHRLFDIKLVLRSGLLYGGLSAVAVVAYLGLVAAITEVTTAGAVPNLFAAAAVGLVLVPLHRWSQGSLTRLVYGDRTDPLRALARMAEGLRTAGHDPTGLQPMLASIALALRSPAATVHGVDGRLVASSTTEPARGTGHQVPLEYAGEPVGLLTIAARNEGERFGRSDRRLVAALTGPVAAAVHAGLLTRELAESRARALAVRQSERRQLREDLHDGVGPSLSGMALSLEAATNNPDRAPEVLQVLHREVDSLIAEVRGIIDDLGPADVDLLAAVRGHVEAMAAAGTVAIELTHRGDLRQLPGEVAVAAQRIVGEALSNAVRHSRATRIGVQVVGAAERLTVEVTDDGTGELRPRPEGVGMTSMRQRAEALGGTLAVTATPGKGTRVCAVLPMAVRP